MTARLALRDPGVRLPRCERGEVQAAAEEALAVDEALASLEATVGDRGFVAELLDDFLSALPAQLEGMRAACAGSDLEALHRGAHTLRSNAATFGNSANRVRRQPARSGTSLSGWGPR